MKNYNFFIVQDGMKVSEELKRKFSDAFSYRDIKSNATGDYYNFVGFVFLKDKALISFPKHYFSSTEIRKLNKTQNNNDIIKNLGILYKLIKQVVNSNSEKLFPVRKEINNSYPFNAFYNIYSYLQRYGMFTKEHQEKSFNEQGKIVWKDTFRRSPMIVNEGNIIYWPPVVTRKRFDYVFVSKCMAYAINSTIKKFPFFSDFNFIDLNYTDIDFSNLEKIIENLLRIKQKMFKDMDIFLVKNLIDFFTGYNKAGSQIQIKLFSFHLIWEDMVNQYLNNFFLEVDDNYQLLFASKKQNRNSFKQSIFDLDERRKNEGIKTYKIIPDFYQEEFDRRYIFDAKYYNSMDELDYKQLSYMFLLKNYQDNYKKVFSALILPTSGEQLQKIHFWLDDNFTKEKVKIIELYLNIRYILKTYLYPIY